MFVVDDLLMAPAHGLFWIFREIHQAAQEALVTDAESITAELSALYMRLETGKLTEEEFAVEEKRLLERLDKIPKRSKAIG
jgi:Gas vesicle protein G